MFKLKLTRNPATTSTNTVTLLLLNIPTVITNYHQLETAITCFEPEQMQVLIKDKYYPLFNCYYNTYSNYYLLEGGSHDL